MGQILAKDFLEHNSKYGAPCIWWYSSVAHAVAPPSDNRLTLAGLIRNDAGCSNVRLVSNRRIPSRTTPGECSQFYIYRSNRHPIKHLPSLYPKSFAGEQRTFFASWGVKPLKAPFFFLLLLFLLRLQAKITCFPPKR
ncbi:predicted protein [Histoplasma capsulatum var. duboisii H88]|uniref:Predicted protein n=2 Tax=Ajellomyces capsulatus TaxID=5037 RepID=F0U9J7_AJEC8|nr:predicted protein [Histoplasma capsulatum H143]EGC41094.1 predicted protein [Histoplasma capsulatum var. duboisii H88]